NVSRVLPTQGGPALSRLRARLARLGFRLDVAREHGLDLAERGAGRDAACPAERGEVPLRVRNIEQIQEFRRGCWREGLSQDCDLPDDFRGDVKHRALPRGI